MKKYIKLVIIFFGSINFASSQCSCGVGIYQDLSVQDVCCYYLEINGTFCPNYSYGKFHINSFASQFNCKIYSLTGLGGTSTFIDGNDTYAYVEAGNSGWGLQPGVDLTIAEICFQHGSSSMSDVQLQLDEFDANGVSTGPWCKSTPKVNATCSYSPPIDCSCNIDITQVNPNDCCYEVGVKFTGADCSSLNYQSIDITTEHLNITTCDIAQLNAAPGFQASAIANNNSGSFSSLTNLGNSSTRQVLGELCLANAVTSLPVIKAIANETTGTLNYCERITEVFVDCVSTSPFQKLIGDDNHNIVSKVLYSGANKMIVVGFQFDPVSNDNYGTIMQIDLSTHMIDFNTQGPLGTIFRDAAYHEGTGEIFVVGSTTPDIGVDNKSIIVKIGDGGACDDIKEFDLGGSESFNHIIYHPTIGMGDLYIVAHEESLSVSGYNNFVLKMDELCNISWMKEINTTGFSNLNLNLVPVPGDGVMVVGESSSQNGLYFQFDYLGNKVDDGEIVNNSLKIQDGFVYSNQNKILIGSDSRDGGIITLWDANNNFMDGISMPDLFDFNDMATDGQKFCAVGKMKDTNFFPRLYIVEFRIIANQIIVDGKYSIDNGETSFANPSVNYHKDSDFMLYADSRVAVGNLFFDMFVTAFDNIANANDCVDILPLNDVPYFAGFSAPQLTISNFILPNPVNNGTCVTNSYDCETYCIPPCAATFTFQQTDCHNVQFTSTVSGVSPITYAWTFTGGSPASSSLQKPTIDFGMPGTYNVCLDIVGADGCADQFCDMVTVVAESVPPTITCNPNIFDSVPACEKGKIISFTIPTALDNCGDANVICSHQSGGFFPCGSTTVTCTATDDVGNTSSCSFVINISCTCVQAVSQQIVCTAVEDQFYIEFSINDLTGATSCTSTFSLLGAIGNLTNTTASWSGTTLNGSGFINATIYPFPTSFGISIDLSCACPDQSQFDCAHDIYFTTPCCDTVSMAPLALCKVMDEQLINIDLFGTVNDIVQIDYYVQDTPCPSTYWGGTPYQTSLGYMPLRILPRYHNTDICVYAIIQLGSGELPCTFLTTEIVEYKLCYPYECNLIDQSYCYTGIPITANPISYSGPLPDCDYIIEWYDSNGQLMSLPSNTLTIQPPPLIYNGLQGDCFVDFTYEMRIIGACGPSSCTSTIRLWNDDAETGDLYLDPIENLPLCYGEDVSIRYDEKCTDPTKLWNWTSSIDGVTFTNVVGAGNANPYYNSNKLYQDQWYRVERQNGLCAVKNVELYIPVKQPLRVSTFTAEPYNPCRDDGMKLNVTFSACMPSLNNVCNCDFTIDWYKNGLLVGTNQSIGSNGGFQYVDSALQGNYGGSYYAVITDNCCGESQRSGVDIVRGPIGLGITGPCYICVPGTMINLQGIVFNGPADGTCIYQWYYDDGTTGYQIWGGGTTTSIMTSKPGRYKLEMDCVNGSTNCMKEAEYEVMECFPITSVSELGNIDFDFVIAPNPAHLSTSILFKGNIESLKELEVYRYDGLKIQAHKINNTNSSIILDELPSGVYLLKVKSDSAILTKKLIML